MPHVLKNPKLLESFQQRPWIEKMREGVSLVVANFLLSDSLYLRSSHGRVTNEC